MTFYIPYSNIFARVLVLLLPHDNARLDGKIELLNLAVAEDDPAGDARPEAACVENMMSQLEELL